MKNKKIVINAPFCPVSQIQILQDNLTPLIQQKFHRMGNDCKSGAGVANGYDFEYFQNKYGKQTMAQIFKQNVRKEQILQKMPQIAQKYRKIIHNFKIDSIRQLNILQITIYNEIETKLKEIQKADTGEVTKAQSHYGICAEDLMGRPEISKVCSQLRQKLHEVYDQQEKNTKETIQKNFQTYVQNLEQENKKRITEIDQLSPQSQQVMKKQMRKKFKKEIKSYRAQINQQIEQGKISSMIHIRQDYNHLHPRQEIENIEEMAEKLIKQGEEKIHKFIASRGSSRQIVSSPVYTPGMTPVPSPGFWGCCRGA